MHSRRGACQLIGKKMRRVVVLGQDTRDSRLHLVAPPLVCRPFHDDCSHLCPQEVVGPQDGKSELDQFSKLFVGGLDYSATDSRTTLCSKKVSSSFCSYELNVDAPKDLVQDGTACTVAFVDAFSARQALTLCVCVRNWVGD
uniref:Uncharacterized protein n=1 Tax=Ixodes ricinus TaxID=34613 RepID=V5HQD2_IXORI